jgi:hypothetical protein
MARSLAIEDVFGQIPTANHPHQGQMMSHLFAIRGPRNLAQIQAAPAPGGGVLGGQEDSPTVRLLKMVPGEAVSFYGSAVAAVTQLREKKWITDPNTFFWLLVVVAMMALILLVVIRRSTTKDPATGQTQWEAVGISVISFLISVISFLIYAYTIGGPFQHFPMIVGPGWQGAIGFIMASFWTSLTPYLFAAR